ncbi:dioxygenase [Pseudoduganella sp. GCM10020061]|uniref:dioxygenase family protein n=1 Tax=Pseudoduganella sp. GCM10020061 TaxID=3317345 RepID=UPI003626ABF1
MASMPSLFISHGAPTLAISDSPARHFLAELGARLPRPSAILVASAHWETNGQPSVSLAERPATIHDFGGFPPALYEMRYPAPGAPDMAQAAAALLEQAGFSAGRSATRGLDHGAWVPLTLMYPSADIPVAQLSVVRGATPADHERMGRALAPLRDQGVLVVGSGSLTHNLYEFRGQPIDSAPPDWVRAFGDWMKRALEGGDLEALRQYRAEAPHAVRNHPTEEHLLPLFVALGAGAGARARQLHASHEYGVLAMDVYAFGGAEA